MTDPNRFIREMYVTQLYGICECYDGKAPSTAVPPYAVIRNIGKSREVTKCTIYNCAVTLDLYNQFIEIGNTESLDLLADDILTAVLGKPLPAIDNFGHVRAELTGDDQDVIEQEDVKVYRKTLRINHWVQE